MTNLELQYKRSKHSYAVAKNEAIKNDFIKESRTMASKQSYGKFENQDLRKDATEESCSSLRLEPVIKESKSNLALECAKELSLSRPSSPMYEHISHNETQHYIMELKTAGLRQGRENKLVEQFHRISSTFRDSISTMKDALAKWINYSDDCVIVASEMLKTAKKDLEKAIQQRDTAITNARDAVLMNEETLAELEIVKNENLAVIEKTTNEKKTLVHENKLVLKKIVAEMEREVEKIKAEILGEAKQAGEELRKELENKQVQVTDKMEATIEILTIKNEEYKERLIAQDKGFNTILDTKENEMKDLRLTEVSLKDRIENIQRTIKWQKEEITKWQQAMERARKEKEAQFQKEIVERQKELDDIERRVKNIITPKDIQIRGANEKAQKARKAEEKLKALENVINNFEEGFEDLTPNLSGNETK